MKVWVVTSVRLLIEAHELKETKALKIVREIFAKAGATGRKGAPLSASTIRDWCEKAHLLASNETEAWIGREVARHLDEYRDLSGWPGTYDAAISWIGEIASDPLLKCKYR